MIITRTPFRISFAGGGSDLKEYYREYGGAVLSVAINKYVFLSMHPYFHFNKYFLKYSKSEFKDSVDEIDHKIIRTVFKDYGVRGVDFNSSADVPSGTGLGSSSAFTVGLINLCNAYTNKYMSKEDIANYACEVEIERLGEPIGKQDQYGCAMGGINLIEFKQDDSVTVEKVLMRPMDYKTIQRRLLLFYTGKTRSASAILTEQKANTVSKQDKIDNLHKMVGLAHQLYKELLAGNVDALGQIMHQGWLYKRELASAITDSSIDYYYDLAMKNGAEGGKLLGAGGGGFFLFYVKEENHERLRRAIKDLDEYPFEFDGQGTTVVYYK